MTNLFGKMGIVCRPRVEEYYGYPIRTKSGSIATITDGANNVPIRDGVFNIDYDANGYSWIRLCKSALNLCGGEAFLHNANRYLPAITINTERLQIQQHVLQARKSHALQLRLTLLSMLQKKPSTDFLPE